MKQSKKSSKTSRKTSPLNLQIESLSTARSASINNEVKSASAELNEFDRIEAEKFRRDVQGFKSTTNYDDDDDDEMGPAPMPKITDAPDDKKV